MSTHQISTHFPQHLQVHNWLFIVCGLKQLIRISLSRKLICSIRLSEAFVTDIHLRLGLARDYNWEGQLKIEPNVVLELGGT